MRTTTIEQNGLCAQLLRGVCPESAFGQDASTALFCAPLSPLLLVSAAVRLVFFLQLKGTDWVAYRIEHAEVEGLPLPTSVVAAVVRSWPGGKVEGAPEAPRAMILARWPLRATRIRVRDDVLVLHRDEPILVESVDGGGGV